MVTSLKPTATSISSPTLPGAGQQTKAQAPRSILSSLFSQFGRTSLEQNTLKDFFPPGSGGLTAATSLLQKLVSQANTGALASASPSSLEQAIISLTQISDHISTLQGKQGFWNSIKIFKSYQENREQGSPLFRAGNAAQNGSVYFTPRQYLPEYKFVFTSGLKFMFNDKDSTDNSNPVFQITQDKTVSLMPLAEDKPHLRQFSPQYQENAQSGLF